VSTIYDRAVRALQPVMGETGEDGYTLAYCCPPGCRHNTCAAVHLLEDAGLLHYGEPAAPDTLALAAAYDHVVELADRLCQELEKDSQGVPFRPGPWNAYWALRYHLDGKNPDGSDPAEERVIAGAVLDAPADAQHRWEHRQDWPRHRRRLRCRPPSLLRMLRRRQS
jgi:hypothetical protein